MVLLQIPGSNIKSSVDLNIQGEEIKIEIDVGGRNGEPKENDPYGDFQGICEKCSCWVSVRETAVWGDFGMCVEHLDCSDKIYDF